MQVNIHVTLSDEDIREGITAQHAVDMVFPYAAQPADYNQFPSANVRPAPVEVEEPEVEIQEDEQTVQEETVSINNEQQEEVNTEPAPGSLPPRDDVPGEQELDSAGVPWDPEIHSSGRSQYKSGADKGRWVWKRGSDETERERIATILAEEAARAAPKSEPTPPAPPVVGPGNPVHPQPTPVAPTPVPGPVFPRPDNTQAPTVAPVADAAAPAGGHLVRPVDWKDLLNALDANNIDAMTTQNALVQIGVDQIALLARDDAQEKRDELAATLGLL